MRATRPPRAKAGCPEQCVLVPRRPLRAQLLGLGKHVLDLPVKPTLPFALWAAFYLRQLTGEFFGAADG